MTAEEFTTWLADHGLNGQAAAAYLGCSASMISQMRAGKRTISAKIVELCGAASAPDKRHRRLPTPDEWDAMVARIDALEMWSRKWQDLSGILDTAAEADTYTSHEPPPDIDSMFAEEA